MAAETAMGIFELVVVFGGILAIGFWELYALRRDRRRRGDQKQSGESE